MEYTVDVKKLFEEIQQALYEYGDFVGNMKRYEYLSEGLSEIEKLCPSVVVSFQTDENYEDDWDDEDDEDDWDEED